MAPLHVKPICGQLLSTTQYKLELEMNVLSLSVCLSVSLCLCLSLSLSFVPWTVRSPELSFPRRINTADLSLLRPFIPWTVHSLKLSFQVPGPFLPRTIRSFVGTTGKAIGKLNKASLVSFASKKR